jgi:glutamate synthase domain-containing protein 3
MTGGVVVVLGETGRNFGAGMTNGVAFVYDPSGDFPTRLNLELVAAARLEDPADEVQLRALIVEHHERTGSRRAAVLLEDWAAARASFWKVAPKSAATPSSAPVGAAGGARA